MGIMKNIILLLKKLKRSIFCFYSLYYFNTVNRSHEREMSEELYKIVNEQLKMKDTDYERCIVENLTKYFGLYEYMRILAVFIIKRYKEELISEMEYENYLVGIRAIDTQVLSTEKWKLLSFISSAFSLFQIGYAFRKKAIESVFIIIGIKKTTDYLFNEAFNASMDINKYEKVRMLLKLCSNNRIKKHLLYFNMMTVNKVNSRKIRRFSREDTEFANYIRGKNVAIIGPALSEVNHGDEIDTFDVVIRLNYRGSDKLPDKIKVGKKTNVSYYNNLTIRNLNVNEKEIIYNDLNYWVVPQKSVAHENDFDIINRKGRERHILLFYFMGYPNLIQHILLDILIFDPKRIKIFDVNFFMANMQHQDNYVIKKLSKQEFVYSSAVHDLISQINFIRQLWQNRQCEVDETCENILRLSNEEYLKNMEEIYTS